MLGFNKQDIQLTLNLFKMAVRDRYLGSTLGSFWAIVNPFLMFALYIFVFGFVFKVRLPGSDTAFGYVIWLIVGFGPWNATSEAIMASTTSVVSASGVVKNMAFKTELLPIASALIGLISLVVSLCFVLIITTIDGNIPSWHAAWIPVLMVLQFYLIISMGIWLAALNVFVRDLSFILPTLLTITLYITPIFYPIENMPVILQKISLFNPFYLLADAYRQALITHQSPGVLGLVYIFILATSLFILGLSAFRRVKGFFDSAL
jgi:lipopolysaccharide transport system permease protein